MLPREHGAYGQLLFPMVTALAIGHPGGAAFAWAAAGALAFLAHEPLVVLAGLRGSRASRDDRQRARRWLAAYLSGAALLGSLALVWMPHDARLAVAVPVSLGALLAIVIGARREHTVWGEVLSAIVMASLALPAAIASEVPVLAARTCAAVFAGGYASATLAVHAVIARTRRPPATRARAAAALGGFVVVALIAAAAPIGVLHSAGAIAVLPMAAGAIALAWVAPPARRLRAVGWTLIAISTVAAGIAIAALRA